MSTEPPTLPAGGRPPHVTPRPTGDGPAPKRATWIWVLAGFIGLTIVLTLCVVGIMLAFLQRPAVTTPGGPSPTIILFQSPAPTVTQTPIPPTPGPTPTDTPLPTATFPPTTPGSFIVGTQVQVLNTGGTGLSMREGPGTEFPRVAVAFEGELLEITDGPRAIGEFTWWELQRTDGVKGWGVENYLQRVP